MSIFNLTEKLHEKEHLSIYALLRFFGILPQLLYFFIICERYYKYIILPDLRVSCMPHVCVFLFPFFLT